MKIYVCVKHVPDTAASFVLIVHDVSAPVGQGMDDRLHWMVWGVRVI